MKNKDVISIYKILENIKTQNIGDQKFKYFIIRNISNFKNSIEIFAEQEKTIYKNVENIKNEFSMKSKNKTDAEKIILEKELKEKFHMEIEKFDKEMLQYSELLEEESTQNLKIYKIKHSTIPNEINNVEYQILDENGFFEE